MPGKKLAPRHLGIMEGRLVPPTPGRFQCFPRERWADEFQLAKDAGLDAIEWIHDLFGADVNPLATDEGLDAMRRRSAETGVVVRSVCADYFMDKPLVRATPAEREERLADLRWLIGRCAAIGIERMVLPFVDASAIRTPQDRADVVSALRAVLPDAERLRVELHLETALGPADFKALLDELDHPLVKVNYDAGNSASLGYRPADEFAAYGDRVGSVHVKDRVLGAGTVPLGTGNTDLPGVFRALADVGYAGDLVLQVARGVPGDEVGWTRANVAYVRRLVAEAQR